jgi:hypothetical protein
MFIEAPSFELDFLDESGRSRGQGGMVKAAAVCGENKRNPLRKQPQDVESWRK